MKNGNFLNADLNIGLSSFKIVNTQSMFLFLSALICSFLYPQVEATLRPGPNTPSFEATYLYMKPISDLPYFASQINSARRFTGERFANEFEFSSGYRIEGDYVLCDCEYDIRGSWTHLTTNVHRTLPLGNYVPVPMAFNFNVIPLTIPQDVRSIEYDAFDLLWGYTFLNNASFITINGGIHWAKIHLDEELLFLNANMSQYARGDFSSHMHGIGPELGLIGKWRPPFCWNSFLFLNGRLEGGILISRIDSDFDGTLPVGTTIGQKISNDNREYVVPHWSSSVGLSVERKLGLRLSAEVGYMIIGYHQALDFIRAGEDAFVSDLQAFDFRDNIYFHGLYITMGITY